VLLGLQLSTAAFWSPEKIAKSRDRRDELIETNRQIGRKAVELAQLLEQRTWLHETSGFSSRTHYHVCDVIEAAAGNHSLFNAYVKDRLDALCAQFDLKYWPSLDQVVRALAADADSATLEATHPLTRAATTGTRTSRTNFSKALLAAIEVTNALNDLQTRTSYAAISNTYPAQARSDVAAGTISSQAGQMSRPRALSRLCKKLAWDTLSPRINDEAAN